MEKNTLSNHIKNILWICKPFWKWGRAYILLSVIVLGLYSSIDDILYVKFPEIILDLLYAGKPFLFIACVAAGICVISFLNNAIRKVARIYFTKKSTELRLKAGREIYEKAMGLDYKYIDDPEYYNSYAWAVDEYADQMEKGRELLVSFSQCLLSLAALVTIIATLGPWILLVEVAQMLLHMLVNTRVNANVIREKEATVPLDRRLGYIHRLFYMKDFAADMRSTTLSGSVFQEYARVGKEKVRVAGTYARKAEFWNIIHEVIFCLTEVGIVLYLVHSIVTGRIPEVGMYMTMILAFYRLDTKVDMLTYLLKDAAVLSMNAAKIREFFAIEPKIESDVEKGAVPDSGSFSVELKNVGFSYENSEFSLSGLDLQIHAGEKIAIVGENGAGKSTFVKLMLRLYDVDEGEICINGRPIRDYDVHLLRQRIGVAFQNTNIYAMSFADNVSLYGDISETALHETTRKLGLDEVLEKNQADEQAELTREFYEDGILLSGGEAQRVGLARVMSRDFSLLLLDEPSSALDPLAEYKMSQAILSAANTATTIIVAHRLSTIRDADRIVVFDHGRICECGSHDELMALQGKYCEMFTKQAENYVRP